MKLGNQVNVPVGCGGCWRVLLDVQRAGSCMPGTQVKSVDGERLMLAVTLLRRVTR